MNEEAAGGKKKKKGGKSGIDILSILGLIVAIGLIYFGIVFEAAPSAAKFEGGADSQEYKDAVVAYEEAGGAFHPERLQGFVDMPSVAITIGGCFAALMVAYPLSVWAKLGKWMKIVFLPSKYDPNDYIAQIVDFAKEARIKGLLSLEDKLSEANDPFLKSSLMLVVDSVEPEKVHNLLEAELDKMDERHGLGRAFMDSGGAFAPGFGMIGTLIGLINMLGSMDDPSSIGPAMAVALLTTLYGSMLANLVFSPFSTKLGIRHNEEYLCRELICEGVEAIQAGENPKFIEEKLNMLILQKKKKGKKKGGAEEASE